MASPTMLPFKPKPVIRGKVCESCNAPATGALLDFMQVGESDVFKPLGNTHYFCGKHMRCHRVLYFDKAAALAEVG